MFPTAAAHANAGVHIKLPAPLSTQGSPKSPRSPRALSLGSSAVSVSVSQAGVGNSQQGGSVSAGVGLFGGNGAAAGPPVSPSRRRHLAPGQATSPSGFVNGAHGSTQAHSPNRMSSGSSVSSSMSVRSSSMMLHSLRQVRH